MSNLTFIEYIKLLDERDIQLYDYHKRISYARYLDLNTKIQKGGSLYSGNFNKNKIFELNKPQLERVILDLVSKDYTDINNIIDIYF
jgi:hypothetical protein